MPSFAPGKGTSTHTNPGCDQPSPRSALTAGLRVIACVVVVTVGLTGTPQIARAADPFDPSRNRPARVGWEALGGISGFAVGSLAGGGLTYLLTLAEQGSCHDLGCLGPQLNTLAGALLGGALLLAPGVYLAGRWTGANGRAWAPVVGEAAGIVVDVGLLLTLPDRAYSDYFAVPTWLSVISLPIVGAVIGYELSTSRGATPAGISPPLRLVVWSGAF